MLSKTSREWWPRHGFSAVGFFLAMEKAHGIEAFRGYPLYVGLFVHDFTHFTGQGGRREGLLQEGHTRFQPSVADDRGISITRQKEHLQFGTQRCQLFSKNASTYSRHHQIG